MLLWTGDTQSNVTWCHLHSTSANSKIMHCVIFFMVAYPTTSSYVNHSLLLCVDMTEKCQRIQMMMI